MIERYLTKEMKELFSEQHRFETFLKVEIAATHAFQIAGVVPFEDYIKIRDNATFELSKVKEIEEITHHDVVAFTRAVSLSLGEEKKWIHYGLTSTDVVDTAMGVIYQEADKYLRIELNNLLEALKEKALKYQNTPCIGRTHGIHADITSFGLKWALFYDEIKRDMHRFDEAAKEIEVGKISGAVGNFAFVPMNVQDSVLKELNLGSVNISTQVLPRDIHAYYSSVLALIGAGLEQIGVEIRNLQRTEIHECEEYFSKGQKGSSAMPHKRNPISSENVCGGARMLRGYMIPMFEDVALYHERDISHSSVERVALADQISLLHYLLRRMTKIVKNLIVYEDQMKKNIMLTHGVIFSQKVLTLLIGKGLSRETSYDLVQPISMESYDKQISFLDLVRNNNEIKKYLTEEELANLDDYSFYMKNIPAIYRRIGLIK